MSKPTQVVYMTRRTPAQLEQVRVQLDSVRAPDEALGRKLYTRSRASEIAEEFRAARRAR